MLRTVHGWEMLVLIRVQLPYQANMNQCPRLCDVWTARWSVNGSLDSAVECVNHSLLTVWTSSKSPYISTFVSLSNEFPFRTLGYLWICLCSPPNLKKLSVPTVNPQILFHVKITPTRRHSHNVFNHNHGEVRLVRCQTTRSRSCTSRSQQHW